MEKERAHKEVCGEEGRLVLLCLLDWTHLQAHAASDTNVLINLRVFKPLFIFFHYNCPLRAYCIACRAATAVFFSFVKNWYIFHCVFPFYIFVVRQNGAHVLNTVTSFKSKYLFTSLHLMKRYCIFSAQSARQ